MLTRIFLQGLFLGAFVLGATPLMAEKLSEDNEHVKRWNEFADNVLELHNELVDEHPVKVKERVGGYFRQPDFYVEKQYIDESSGEVLSVVQWVKENPEVPHTMEVFIRDDQGRKIRDYTVAFLPGYRNAPTQALVSFHNYNGDLHAFRSFDASGYRVVERCVGTYKGKDVNFILDEGQIADALDGVTDIMQTDKYKACFKGVPQKAGEHLHPS